MSRASGACAGPEGKGAAFSEWRIADVGSGVLGCLAEIGSLNGIEGDHDATIVARLDRPSLAWLGLAIVDSRAALASVRIKSR